MADDKFSLDDLLNEYSEPSDKSAGMSLNLDEVLRSIEAEEQKYITRELAAVGAASAAQESAPQPVIPDPEPFNSEMEERRMDLIRREIISGDYEHKYLGEDFKDVIEEEKRRKAERLAQTMTIRGANDDYDLPEIQHGSHNHSRSRADTENASEAGGGSCGNARKCRGKSFQSRAEKA